MWVAVGRCACYVGAADAVQAVQAADVGSGTLCMLRWCCGRHGRCGLCVFRNFSSEDNRYNYRILTFPAERGDAEISEMNALLYTKQCELQKMWTTIPAKIQLVQIHIVFAVLRLLGQDLA